MVQTDKHGSPVTEPNRPGTPPRFQPNHQQEMRIVNGAQHLNENSGFNNSTGVFSPSADPNPNTDMLGAESKPKPIEPRKRPLSRLNLDETPPPPIKKKTHLGFALQSALNASQDEEEPAPQDQEEPSGEEEGEESAQEASVTTK